MADITPDAILAALGNVTDPDKGKDIVSLGMVSGLQVRDGHVVFAIEVEPERGPKLEPVRKAAETAVHALPGVLTVNVALTAERPAAASADVGAGHDHPSPQPSPRAGPLAHVGAIVAVASGKGGVGKSTTAVNLAVALAQAGHSTGLLDADIYGPSVPRMVGLAGKPYEPVGDSLKPVNCFGVSCMSIGFFVEEENPVIWRGPMATGALNQLLNDVDWGALDILLIDLPPGTGDIHLTMVQQLPLSGAIIVSTPQDVALADTRKGLNMFRKVEVPVLGIIENMSYFLCPDNGKRYDIFGHGGAKAEAQRLGVEFLGEVPIDIAIRETSDGGTPIVSADPDNPQSAVYRAVAARLWEQVAAGGHEHAAAPNILIQ